MILSEDISVDKSKILADIFVGLLADTQQSGDIGRTLKSVCLIMLDFLAQLNASQKNFLWILH